MKLICAGRSYQIEAQAHHAARVSEYARCRRLERRPARERVNSEKYNIRIAASSGGLMTHSMFNQLVVAWNTLQRNWGKVPFGQ